MDEYEKIDRLDRAAEYIMLGMRRTRGISSEEYRRIYPSSFEPIEDLLKDFEKNGWAKQAAGRWSFTSSGFLLSNTLIGDLLEAQTENKLVGNPWMKSSFPDDLEYTVPSGVGTQF